MNRLGWGRVYEYYFIRYEWFDTDDHETVDFSEVINKHPFDWMYENNK